MYIMIEDPRYSFEVEQNSDTTSSCSIVRALPSPTKRASEATLLPKHWHFSRLSLSTWNLSIFPSLLCSLIDTDH